MTLKTTWRGLSLVLLAVFLAGCVGPPTEPSPLSKDPFFESWRRNSRPVTESREASAGDKGISHLYTLEEPEEVAPLREEERPLPTKRIGDLAVGAETDVKVILRALARAGDQDILIGPSVSGSVSLHLTDVAWDRAFKAVLSSAGLTYAWEGDIIRVMTIDDLKRELELAKIEQERRRVQAEMEKVEPLAVQLLKVKYADVAKLGESLEKTLLLGMEGAAAKEVRGSVTVDEESNTLIIHALPRDMRKLITLAGKLDRRKPQVLIEANIVEANRSTARELGIQWGMTYSGIDGQHVYSVTPGSERAFSANFPATLKDDVGFTVGFISDRFGGGEILNIQLSALQEDGKINILSSPSITTLDNETAHIESGEERAYRETTGTGNELDVSIQWKKAVLKLEVTPHVVDEEHLKMEILANKDSFDETKPESTGEFPVNTKNAKTTVLVRNGETTVIGGLSQESKSRTDSGIPILADIPLLGYLFRGSRTRKEFDETLIFITPRIIVE